MKAGAIIFNRNFTRVLLVKNRNSQKWGFPKGSPKKDETSLKCAVREVKEETNIDLVENGNVFGSVKLSHYLYLLGVLQESVRYKINDWNELDSIKFIKIENLRDLELNSSLKQFFSLYNKNPKIFNHPDISRLDTIIY